MGDNLELAMLTMSEDGKPKAMWHQNLSSNK